jgi:hypothetical protein
MGLLAGAFEARQTLVCIGDQTIDWPCGYTLLGSQFEHTQSSLKLRAAQKGSILDYFKK